MTVKDKDIQVKVIGSSGREFIINTYRGEYRNLMMLIYDQCYEDIGECKGIGLCGTCHVHVLRNAGLRESPDEKEQHTLGNSLQLKENSRLSCQIMIDEKINGLVVKVINAE